MKAGIVGEGILGQLLAFSLINAGWQVTLFDAGKQQNCSRVAAGLLTPLAELAKNDFIIFQLGLESIQQHWPRILLHLKNEIYFQQLGSLILSHQRDQVDLNRFMETILAKINDKNYYQAVNHDEIRKLEPDITHFQQGYYFICEGHIDNQTFMNEMKSYLDEKKIIRMPDSLVMDVKPGSIILSSGSYEFDCVFDCRGLGAKSLFSDLRSVRGELIWLHAPDIFIQRPVRFLHPRYSLYIVPRPQQIYLIGASEIESEDESSISVRTTLELLTAAGAVTAKFLEARIINTMTQCRPTLPNHLPKIKYSDKFVAINGLYRHGFLVAPALVVEVMRWLQHGLSAVCYPQLFEACETWI